MRIVGEEFDFEPLPGPLIDNTEDLKAVAVAADAVANAQARLREAAAPLEGPEPPTTWFAGQLVGRCYDGYNNSGCDRKTIRAWQVLRL